MRQIECLNEGDIVITPGRILGIVVGIYGVGYCEVLINKDTSRAKIVPYRKSDLTLLPASEIRNSAE